MPAVLVAASALAAGALWDQDSSARSRSSGPLGVIAIDRARIGGGEGAHPATEPPVLLPGAHRVAFTSRAADLAPVDDHENSDVFVAYGDPAYYDGVELASGNTDWNAEGTGDSYDFSMSSASAEAIAFTSTYDDPDAGDDNGLEDVYVSWLDHRRERVVDLVSVDDFTGRSGTGRSYNPTISPGGGYVTFISDAKDLLTPFGTKSGNLYVRRFGPGGGMRVLSVSDDRSEADLPVVGHASISADSRFFAFTCAATNLADLDTDTGLDVFVRDLTKERTILASPNSAGTASGNGDSLLPVISTNGKYVAFVSDASDLVAGDDNGARDVFLFDMRRRKVKLVSARLRGRGSGNGASDSGWIERPPAISANGRFVAFVSDATDLVEGPVSGGRNVYIRDMRRGRTRLVSESAASVALVDGISTAPAISSNGRLVAFTSDSFAIPVGSAPYGVFVRDMRREGAEFVHDSAIRESVASAPRSRYGKKSTANRVFGFSTGYLSEEGSVFIVWLR